jgi:hypothetical protein
LADNAVAVPEAGAVQVVRPFVLDAAARSRLHALERAMMEMPQFECPVKHYFADGVYVREIFIPAGVALVGYVHLQDCVSSMLKGVLAITDGSNTTILRAPMIVTVPAGSKKAGYAIEDTVFSDCYANPDNEMNIDVLEARLVVNSHEAFLEHRGAQCLLP